MPGNKKLTKLDRCVASVMEQGKSKDSAYAICQASISGKKDDTQKPEETKKSIEHHGTTFPGYNKPTKSNRAGKKKMVLAKSGDRVKVIHYGDTNYEHNYSAEAKSSFRARHKCDEQKDKLTASYWACKDLWPTGSTKKSSTKQMKDDPCWEGYEMVGHKIKDGKKVPNCVPKSTKKSGSFSMKKLDVKQGEEFILKGFEGEVYLFRDGALFKETPVVQKATVLKSLRTEKGAADWLSLMSKNYPDAVIMDTETLKSFGTTLKAAVEGIKDLPEMPFHVVNVEGVDGDSDDDTTPGNMLNGEMGEENSGEELMEDEEQEDEMNTTQIAQTLHDAMKLHEMITSGEIHLEPWMNKKLALAAEYLNAIAENVEHGEGEIPEDDGSIKDLMGAATGMAPDGPGKDVKKMQSDPAMLSVNVENIVKSVIENITMKNTDNGKPKRQPGGISQVAAEQEPTEQELDTDEGDTDEGKKSVTGKVFKSLNAARQWNRFENPDKDRYYIDIMREHDVRKSFSKSTGLNAKYIVRDRSLDDTPEEKGSFGNRLKRKGF